MAENASLDEYRRKRDFSRTPEPAGDAAKPEGAVFVVQKHAASHLHYDFRLQFRNTLKSWAVPKGPSLDPSQHRLAQQTEDHPLEYASFEGVIPPGQYGAGSVLLWDMGEWEPLGEGKQGFYRGRLQFMLHGSRLKGRWSLVRQERDLPAWHLIKEEDEYATTEDILREERSVRSGRTMDEIAADRDALWTRDEGLVPEEPENPFGHAPGGVAPEFVLPQAATLMDAVPEGDEWLHEIKYDGYRMLCTIDRDGNGVRLYSRKRTDFTERLQHLARALARLPVNRAVLDGEIVVFTDEGKSDFNGLQNAFTEGAEQEIVYLVFDLLNYEGYDITQAPLSERKALLADLVKGTEQVRFVDHVIGNGGMFYREACRVRLEGVVSKRLDGGYISGRTRSWIKVKCAQRQEFIVGGYTESGVGRPFGSLLAGYYDAEGRLVFAGKIKTGYNARLSDRLISILRRHEQAEPPFVNAPSGVEYRNPHWLRPELVAEVEFTEMSGTGLLRHASFKGLREDKPAREVRLEVASPPPERPPPREPPVYPRERLTWADLRTYYAAVADRMLPYIANRPLTLIACPVNIYACKFTKHATNLPPPVKGIDIAGHQEQYITVDSVEGLLVLVEHHVIEIHGWQSRHPRVEFPDRLLFDLDPPDTGELPWEQLAEGALLLRLHLQEYGLESFIQTTGGKGYYVVAPLAPTAVWQQVTPFARRVAEEMEKLYPDRFTARLVKNERGGRIYLDWIRNGRGANAAEPYSLRARPAAPVAVPITWEELVAGTRPDSFTLSNLPDRLARLASDPWEDYFRVTQTLR